MQLRLPKIENLLMALAAAVAFGLSFRVNQLFDDFFLYASGMSLLFLPAGVKLLFVLIGRIPAICGIMAVSVYLGYGIWPDKGIGAVIYFAFISLMTYPISSAMTFGDFMGCFAVVGVFQLAVSHLGTHKIET
jgi:hypothetical protein